MNRIRRVFFTGLCLLALTLPALAAGTTLTVSGQTVDLRGLPRQVYVQDGIPMIPFRKTAEALGYTVSWDSRAHCARAEDSIQSVRVSDGSAAARWTGKLTVIDLTRDETMQAKAVVIQGVTYVPALLFQGFFNDVTVRSDAVDVSPQMAYLDQTPQSAVKTRPTAFSSSSP